MLCTHKALLHRLPLTDIRDMYCISMSIRPCTMSHVLQRQLKMPKLPSDNLPDFNPESTTKTTTSQPTSASDKKESRVTTPSDGPATEKLYSPRVSKMTDKLCISVCVGAMVEIMVFKRIFSSLKNDHLFPISGVVGGILLMDKSGK